MSSIFLFYFFLFFVIFSFKFEPPCSSSAPEVLVVSLLSLVAVGSLVLESWFSADSAVF
jgi:hypothetical protein